jgi:hypothetical protein
MRLSNSSTPTTALAVIFMIGNVGWAIAAAFAAPLRPAFLLLYWIGIQWALAWWVLVDCRRRGLATSIDHGWFVFFAWPIVLPYHLLQTRGRRGCLVMAGLLGLFAASCVAALGVFLMLSR